MDGEIIGRTVNAIETDIRLEENWKEQMQGSDMWKLYLCKWK
jgi:hypothetical protein